MALAECSLEKMRATHVVIAHRLNTIRRADCIYVIEKGRAVQQGRFEELAVADGLFTQIIARQTM